jgi:hypothetical protein
MLIGFQGYVKRLGIHERYALFRIEKCSLKTRRAVRGEYFLENNSVPFFLSGRASHPLDYTTLPGRTIILSPFSCSFSNKKTAPPVKGEAVKDN